jgi:hypothetical protein
MMGGVFIIEIVNMVYPEYSPLGTADFLKKVYVIQKFLFW